MRPEQPLPDAAPAPTPHGRSPLLLSPAEKQSGGSQPALQGPVGRVGQKIASLRDPGQAYLGNHRLKGSTASERKGWSL